MLSIQEQVVASFETVKQMLTDRGISIANIEAIGPKELCDLCTTQSIFTLEVNECLCVVYYLTKMKIAEFKSAMFGKSKDIEEDDVRKNDDKTHIFVFKDEISAQNKKSVGEFFRSHQVFQITRLLYNVSHHSLVPQHSLLKDERELQELFARMNIKSKALLPTIHQGDPMAKYMGLVPGDVIKIVRSSPTAGVYNYYRVCVA